MTKTPISLRSASTVTTVISRLCTSLARIRGFEHHMVTRDFIPNVIEDFEEEFSDPGALGGVKDRTKPVD